MLMRQFISRKLRESIMILFLIFLSFAGKCQTQLVHELKAGYAITNQISNVGLFYEIIPRQNFGYELGIIKDKQFQYLPCGGYCKDPVQTYKPYDWNTWTFVLSLKYYFSKKKDHARFYLGAFLLYSSEVPGSISDEFQERLDNPDPIDYSTDVYTNRLSLGGVFGYKMRLGSHLLFEPSLAVGVNVNSPNVITDFESLFIGRIGWRF